MSAPGGRTYQPGDVVWCVDPYKMGVDVSRMFVVISTRTHPFEDEQFVGVTLTTTPHIVAHPLDPQHWTVGGTPKPSYVLPLSIHTPRTSTIQPPPEYDEITDPWQGTLTNEILSMIIGEIVYVLRLNHVRTR